MQAGIIFFQCHSSNGGLSSETYFEPPDWNKVRRIENAFKARALLVGFPAAFTPYNFPAGVRKFRSSPKSRSSFLSAGFSWHEIRSDDRNSSELVLLGRSVPGLADQAPSNTKKQDRTRKPQEVKRTSKVTLVIASLPLGKGQRIVLPQQAGKRKPTKTRAPSDSSSELGIRASGLSFADMLSARSSISTQY